MDERIPSPPGTKANNGNVAARTREIAEEAEHELSELRERLDDMSERVTGFIRERPGTAIAIALGAGYLIGRMLRS